jgi:crotonobetainyl-CoA:carnitine CoA-transferase CaiB-like acyl-CoA transferase
MLTRTDGNSLCPISVLEVGERIAVGAAGTLFAQLGARVTLVEPKSSSRAHKWCNRPVASAGKQSIVIDRRDPEGKELLRRLAGAVDVVLISSDVDADDLGFWNAAFPDGPLVCDITAFGHTGPLSGMAWPEHLIAALSGIVDTTGSAGCAPALIGTSVLEMHSALFAVAAILAACRVKRLQGVVQSIDVAIYDVAVNGLINFITLHLAGKPVSRTGNRHPLFSPWGAYRAADGWILICAVTDDHWAKLCGVMSTPDLAAAGKLKTLAGRVENHGLVDEIVENWTRNHTVAHCELILVQVGIACGPIVTVDELPAQENIRHRRSIFAAEEPVGREKILLPRSPIRSDVDEAHEPPRVPLPDADRAHVLAWLESMGGASGREPIADKPHQMGAFDGVRVVEIGQYTVAPMASRILGALGADVIKVESPAGDAIRHAPPFREDGSSFIFAISNTDKRGLVLDLKVAEDREALHRLLSRADALVENLKPGSLAKLGFGGDELRRRHPHLVVCSVNGFGTASLYPGRAALDTIIQAMSGLMSLTMIDGTPTKTGISTSDMLGGEFSLIALMLGLEYRDVSGRALQFDLSMQDGTLWATQYEWNVARSAPDAQLIRASDGYVVVELPADELAAGLARRRLDSLEQRLPSRKLIVDELSGVARAAPVLTVAEVIEHPQTAARGLLVERPTIDGDRWTVLSAPFRLSRTPATVRSVMSKLGATDRRVREEFGLSLDAPVVAD